MQWIPRLMGIVPLGIGLTVLGFLWLTPFNEFGSPPLFFRVFGSFIALAFVLTGVGFIAGPSLVRGQGAHLKGMMQDLAKTAQDIQRGGPAETSHASPTTSPQVGYDCRERTHFRGAKDDDMPLNSRTIVCRHDHWC